MSIRLDFADPRALPGDAATSPATDVKASGAGGHPPDAAIASKALRCRFEVPLHTLIAHTPAQVKPLLDAVDRFARQGLWCVGYLAYEAASAFDAALQTHPANGPLAWFGVYSQALPWPDNPPADADDDARTSAHWRDPLSREAFDANLAVIHGAIAAGEFYQVNYTAPLHGAFTGSAAALFKRLQRAQPGGYAACIDTGDEQLLSVSPELFFDWDGQHILTRPMKGTAPRGSTPERDAALARGLTESPKERAENVMIVDLLRNDLSRIAQPFSVRVPRLFAVQSLPTVHQMVSDVTAQTRPGTTLSEVFSALFPCGSITGAPKVRAMQMIHTLEPAPRGVYCGAIGVVRPGGHATFNVAIRTVTIRGDLSTCGIGSGITADATAANEWQEWQHKRGFLTRASEPFQLLETLRLQAGVFHNLGAHLARLAEAARHFGYGFDEARIRHALNKLLLADATNAPPLAPAPHSSSGAAAAPGVLPATTVWRVRLLLDASGQVHAEKLVQKNTPEPVAIGLAATPFEASMSEFTRFKTTRRGHYEVFAPTDPAVFDTLLYNTQGQLTECTRGNIAVQLDGQWLTPALHCGLLPGVGRAQFLAEGRVKEGVITLDDLPRASGLAFINSLRGWVEARLQITDPVTPR
ncbi:aminodeoxychorismate synthase component I [Rhodoferax sp. U2-2l]|uniref:aminodeoxychorismate synthase component I n=1 Tax=Rhodoferax sp. U2-2l TaxID=2884000 RepID=UPI001D0BB9C2|nr:aminodeoxychorismate synthase component I [Rhodoferax sp. U2-2l]MCB8748419.1 aminodeoxychorismate synthase component I [Rhodoferax sp. U2-2l]